MAALKGLKAMVSQLREQRTSLVNQIRHVDAALVVLGKLEGRSSLAKPVREDVRSSPQEDCGSSESAMG